MATEKTKPLTRRAWLYKNKYLRKIPDLGVCRLGHGRVGEPIMASICHRPLIGRFPGEVFRGSDKVEGDLDGF